MNGKKYDVVKDENSQCCISSFDILEVFSCAIAQKEYLSIEKIKLKYIEY